MTCKIEGCKKDYYGQGFCQYHYTKWYYQKNRARINKRIEAWRDKTPGYARDKHLRSSYGITLEQYEVMLKAQKGKCKICGRKEWKVINAKGGVPHRLAVDHDADSKKVRGLLCAACNTALGHFQHGPVLLAKAIAYLRT